MKHVGVFSGKIYSEEEKKNMKECGIPINDETAESDTLVKYIYETNKERCNGCGGCPMSREAAGIKYSPYAEISGRNMELVLPNIISASRTIGIMEANGQIDIGSLGNDIEFASFVVNEFVNWYDDRDVCCFEDYFVKKVTEKYGKTAE